MCHKKRQTHSVEKHLRWNQWILWVIFSISFNVADILYIYITKYNVSKEINNKKNSPFGPSTSNLYINPYNVVLLYWRFSMSSTKVHRQLDQTRQQYRLQQDFWNFGWLWSRLICLAALRLRWQKPITEGGVVISCGPCTAGSCVSWAKLFRLN